MLYERLILNGLFDMNYIDQYNVQNPKFRILFYHLSKHLRPLLILENTKCGIPLYTTIQRTAICG